MEFVSSLPAAPSGRKRVRTSKACAICQAGKRKCSEERPCERCRRLGLDCTDPLPSAPSDGPSYSDGSAFPSSSFGNPFPSPYMMPFPQPSAPYAFPPVAPESASQMFQYPSFTPPAYPPPAMYQAPVAAALPPAPQSFYPPVYTEPPSRVSSVTSFDSHISSVEPAAPQPPAQYPPSQLPASQPSRKSCQQKHDSCPSSTIENVAKKAKSSTNTSADVSVLFQAFHEVHSIGKEDSTCGILIMQLSDFSVLYANECLASTFKFPSAAAFVAEMDREECMVMAPVTGHFVHELVCLMKSSFPPPVHELHTKFSSAADAIAAGVPYPSIAASDHPSPSPSTTTSVSSEASLLPPTSSQHLDSSPSSTITTDLSSPSVSESNVSSASPPPSIFDFFDVFDSTGVQDTESEYDPADPFSASAYPPSWPLPSSRPVAQPDSPPVLPSLPAPVAPATVPTPTPVPPPPAPSSDSSSHSCCPYSNVSASALGAMASQVPVIKQVQVNYDKSCPSAIVDIGGGVFLDSQRNPVKAESLRFKMLYNAVGVAQLVLLYITASA